MDSDSTVHLLDQFLFPPDRHNLIVCLDAARWLCEWLLAGGRREPAVRECERIQGHLRDALPVAPGDSLATVQRLLIFLQRASAGQHAGGGGVFFDPLDLARDAEGFWRRVGGLKAQAELRACHALLLDELQAAVTPPAPMHGFPLERLWLVDYYTEPWVDVPAGTPPAVMIAIRALATGKGPAFAWHLVAEEEGIPPEAIPAHKADLERQVLGAFLRHLQGSPRIWWLHWGLHSIHYGFPALAQRAKALGLGDVRFPVRRVIDLAAVFKRALGEDYVPNGRLPHLIELNKVNAYELLDREELTAAFRDGDYARMLRSLLRKLDCLARIVELAALGTLQTARGPFVLPSGAAGGRGPGWMAHARMVLDAGRTPLPLATRQGDASLAVAATPHALATDSAAVPAVGTGPDGGGTESPSPARQLSATERRILRLCRRKAHKGERIAYHLGLSYDHVRRVLARLRREGRLRLTDDGYRTV
jgi:hypothetical protein